MPDNSRDLLPGYVYRHRGTASYAGALRRSPGSAPVWTCDDDHLVAGSAQRCAQAELARRARVQGTVLVLLRCEPCESWFGNVAGVTACPRCGVPLERVTAVVTGRQPAA